MKKKFYLSIPTQGGGGGGGYSAQATQFFSRITDPGTTRKNLYAALIDGLVTDGVWSLLDVLHIYAANSSANALINLKSSSFTASIAGAGTALTFTTDSGYNNGGTTSNASYIDTGFNASTAGGNYTQNSAHYSVWTPTSSTDGISNLYLMSCYDGTTWEAGLVPVITGGVGLVIRCNGGTDTNWPNTNHQGHYIADRPSSSTRTGYKNGSSLGSFSASTSAALVNQNIVLLWTGHAGDSYNNIDTASAESIGASLSTTQALALYNRLNTYMTAVLAAPSLSLTSTPSASTQVGVSYSQTNVASGGTSPYTYSVSAGSVPTSTSLNTSTGTVSGTPTVSGAFSYAITVTDNVSATAAQTSSGTISAAGAWSIPSFATAFGFTNTSFFDDMNSIGTFDMSATFAPGFNWYPGYGNPGYMSNLTVAGSIATIATPGECFLFSCADHSGTFGTGHYNQGSVGKVFAGADGFYWETKLKFNPNAATTQEQWNMSGYDYLNWTGTLVAGNQLVPIAGRHPELDPMDSFQSPLMLAQDLLDYDTSGTVSYSNLGTYGSLYNDLDFSVFHTYGTLIVPMRLNGGTGLVRFYVDRIQRGPDYTWTNPGAGIEVGTIFIVPGASGGATGPLYVDYIGVAQASSAGNWTLGPTSNLTHRWPMKNSQVAGSSVHDVVGTLHGFAGSGISSTVGPLCGQARLSNGTAGQGYITLPSAPITNLAAAWSIAGWVKMVNPATGGGGGANVKICNLDDGTNRINLMVDHSTTIGSLSARNQAGTSLFATPAAIFTAGIYWHFAVTYNGAGTYKVYKQGIPVTSFNTAVTGTPTTGNCFMASSSSASDGFAGAMCEFVTYTRLISDTEVVQIYNAYDP